MIACRASLVLAAVLYISACSQAPAGSNSHLELVIDADDGLRAELDRVDVSSDQGTASFNLRQVQGGAKPVRLPFKLTVAATAGKRIGSLRVRGFSGKQERVRRSVDVKLVQGSTRLLGVYLTASCLDVFKTCDASGEGTCLPCESRCRSASVDAAKLMRIEGQDTALSLWQAPRCQDTLATDASVVDASVVDASVVDASVVDASVVDASVVDASVVDAALVDAGLDASVDACVATTCEDEGKNCDEISNGCGGTIDCGKCVEPAVCGAGPLPNVCYTIGTCDSLSAPGTWEDITPPTVKAQLDQTECPYGVGAFALDPGNSAVAYLGTCAMGVWKTADCGASWIHVNTGINGGALDHGTQGTFVIDPVDPQVMYTNSAFNQFVEGGTWEGNGVSAGFKSSNGGVDWEIFWPPADPLLADIVAYNFVGYIRMDPSDHQHLVVAFSAACNAPHTPVCFAETEDAGTTWSIVDGDSTWTVDDSASPYFLDDSKTWLWVSQRNGMWRTPDAGMSWTQLDVDVEVRAGQLYRASSGVFYLASARSVLRSADGIAWASVQGTSEQMSGITGDGTTLYASRGYAWSRPFPAPYAAFWTSAESDGQQWTQLTAPLFGNAGALAYEPSHHLLYSANSYAGFWRVVTQ